uniref:Putative structural protein n=1 Tax=viral metagenome TaxID=1070528 RepID=A0A6M3JT88_9ZZZZ
MYLLNRRTVSKAKPYLLLHCNGADESTTFTDNSPEGHTVTAVGGAQIDTAQSKFSGASGLFDGDGDYLTVAGGDFNLTTNFSMECFVRFADVTDNTTQNLLGFDDDTTAGAWEFFTGGNCDSLFFRVLDDTPTTIVTLTAASLGLANDIWYHLLACKVGSEYGLYVGGIQKAHVSDASTHAITGTLYVGAAHGAADTELNGWLDEIRIVAGNPFSAAPVAGLTDKIQVPQQPYPSWS